MIAQKIKEVAEFLEAERIRLSKDAGREITHLSVSIGSKYEPCFFAHAEVASCGMGSTPELAVENIHRVPGLEVSS